MENFKPISKTKYKKISASDWTDQKAIVLKDLNNKAGDRITKGSIITIISKTQKRIFEGSNVYDGCFDIESTEGVIIYNIHRSSLSHIISN